MISRSLDEDYGDMEQDVIYDFGMNNGDDLPYYLKKARKVVGVEANPDLCAYVRDRYQGAVYDGRLVILNCVLTDQATCEKATFYIHQNYHVLSQFPKPGAEFLDKFEAIELVQRTASSIISEYGRPHFVKIDLEHYDQYVLKEISSARIQPAYVSVEMHDFVVYDILKSMGYTSFNTVDGETVPEKYNNLRFNDVEGGECSYSFPYHSAGPFGSDIVETPWLGIAEMDCYLRNLEPGWIDLHASLDYVVSD